MFWTFLIGFAVLYLTQTVLGLRQSKNFADTFTAMRRRGKVALGKKQGLLVAGALVLFLLDDAGHIVEGRKLSGVTVLSRFKTFDVYNGLQLADLAPEGDRRFSKPLRGAVANARDNYRTLLAGKKPLDPPGPLAQISLAAGRLVRRRPVATA